MNIVHRYFLCWLFVFSVCLSSGCIKENLRGPVEHQIVETEDLSAKFIMDDWRQPETVVTIVTNHSDKAYQIQDSIGIIEKYDQGSWKLVLPNTDPAYFEAGDKLIRINGYVLLEPGQQYVKVLEVDKKIHFRKGHYRIAIEYGYADEILEGARSEVKCFTWEFDIR